MRFPLRIEGDDEGLWSQFRDWCADNKVSTNSGLILLIRAAVAGKVTIGARRA